VLCFLFPPYRLPRVTLTIDLGTPRPVEAVATLWSVNPIYIDIDIDIDMDMCIYILMMCSPFSSLQAASRNAHD